MNKTLLDAQRSNLDTLRHSKDALHTFDATSYFSTFHNPVHWTRLREGQRRRFDVRVAEREVEGPDEQVRGGFQRDQGAELRVYRISTYVGCERLQ